MRDTGLLPADSIARRVDREMFVLLGGTAALLLQVAHPLVAAGVDQHSDFRRSPHTRLLRTLNTTLAIVFGDRDTAARAISRINGRHVAVRGIASDGRRYDARDPALLLWVQCTLVLTSLRLYELVIGPLRRDERQRYWDEAKVIGADLGISADAAPRTIEELERYERQMLDSTAMPDATSRAVARDVLRPLSWVPEIVWWPTDALAAGLLPATLRPRLNLEYGAPRRLFFRAAIAALRLIVPVLPRYLRIVPHARRRRA
jgi:uncharacterized protein (DUF2236 family)